MCPRPETPEIGHSAPDAAARRRTALAGRIQLLDESADEQFRVRDRALRLAMPGSPAGSRSGLRVPVP